MATTAEHNKTVTPSAVAPAASGADELPFYRRVSQRTAIIVASTLLVIAVVIWAVVESGRRKQEYSARALDQARAMAESGNLPAASAALQQVIQTYPGTAASEEAVLTLNQVRLLNGQSELASVNLREFLSHHHDAQYVASANALLGAALENSHREAEAADAYRQAASNSEINYLKAEYLVEAGRAYRDAGKLADAEAAYREVVQKYPKTTSLTEAQVRLAELTKGKM